MEHEAQGAARLMSICTTLVALHHLAQAQLDHRRVCAAASLALLAKKDVRFVRHLKDNAHLEALVDAAFEAAAASDDADLTMPSGCCRSWHTTAVLIAVAHAARACHISTPMATTFWEEEPDESLPKRPRKGLDAGDVGVQHHDSTIFLIAARPFYVHSVAMEKVSPVFKQAMEIAGGSREPIALPLVIDAPVDRHHALFGLAVEFLYTGFIPRLSDDDAWPLFTLAQFLQIDELRSYLLNSRLRSLMHADVALAERMWAAGMAFPDSLYSSATAIVVHLSHLEGEDEIRALLRRCHVASTAQSPLVPEEWEEWEAPYPHSESRPRVKWVASLFARIMRSELRWL